MAYDPVDLTDLRLESTEPSRPDYGVMQRPVFGAKLFKVNRLGSGISIGLVLPPQHFEPDGRRAIPRLMLAKRQGAIVRYSQPDFEIGPAGSPTVDGAVAGGLTLPITGATPRYAVRQGQAFNIIKSGKKYLYFAAEQSILDGSGDGSIALTDPLRTQLAGGETVDFRACVEGHISGDNFAWPIDRLRMVGLSFTLDEHS